MRITIARLTGLAALLALLLGGAGLGQQGSDAKDAKKPAEEKKPSQLEELIAQALRDNPDLRVADAKLREADAELNRVRLQVIQKVVAHQHTIETLESAVKTAEASYRMAEAKLKQADAEYKRLKSIDAGIAQADLDAGRANLETAKANLDAAKAALQAAKADLAKAQAELPYLLGKSNKAGQGGKLSSTEIGLQALAQQQVIVQELDTLVLREAALNALGTARAKPQGSVADRLRKALDTSTNLKAAAGMPLEELLDGLQKAADVPIVNTLQQNQVTLRTDFNLQNVPLGAAFQCLEDVAGVQLGVRDYGIVVSKTLPPDVTHLHDFWKSEQHQKKVGDKPQ
jgi:multidrug resistance efflux pump